jgi:glycosyltransferase involved in cell wall biosynthesis
MRIVLLCKRLYTNRDLIDDRFGRLFHIPVQLARLGNPVTVVALDYRAGRGYHAQTIGGVEFISVPAAGVVDLVRLVQRSGEAVRQALPDVIVASGDTYIAGLAAAFAKRLSIPWVFDVYDDYRYFASGRIPGMKSWFFRLLRDSDQVLVASHPLLGLTRDFAQVSTVVENGVDTGLFRELDKEDCRNELGISAQDKVIGFFGSIGRKRGVGILLEAAARLRKQYPRLRLLLAGRNALGLNLDQRGVDFRGLVAQDHIPVMINASDVVVVPYERDPLVDATNACKIAEYLACGTPIVATRVSDMESIFSETPQVLVDPGDPDALAERLSYQISHQIVTPFVDALTWPKLSHRVANAISTLVGGSHAQT